MLCCRQDHDWWLTELRTSLLRFGNISYHIEDRDKVTFGQFCTLAFLILSYCTFSAVGYLFNIVNKIINCYESLYFHITMLQSCLLVWYDFRIVNFYFSQVKLSVRRETRDVLPVLIHVELLSVRWETARQTAVSRSHASYCHCFRVF